MHGGGAPAAGGGPSDGPVDVVVGGLAQGRGRAIVFGPPLSGRVGHMSCTSNAAILGCHFGLESSRKILCLANFDCIFGALVNSPKGRQSGVRN